MFFVGATGQLLTLILTVCLPFVLLVSGHHNIEPVSELLSYNAPNTHTVESVLIADGQSSSVTTLIIAAEELSCKPPGYRLQRLKLPNLKHSAILRQVCLDASGNKAPPSILALLR